MTDETIDPFEQQERDDLYLISKLEADRLEKYKNQKEELTDEEMVDYENLLAKTKTFKDQRNLLGEEKEEDSLFDTAKDKLSDGFNKLKNYLKAKQLQK